jgi:hypothetical protein
MSKHKELYMEQFRSAGVLPLGPISPWPEGREIRSIDSFSGKGDSNNINKVQASSLEQLKGFGRTAAQAAMNGKTTKEIRNERLETCFSCEHFISDSARCSLCGCFMQAKTWVAGDHRKLCPAKKWNR